MHPLDLNILLVRTIPQLRKSMANSALTCKKAVQAIDFCQSICESKKFTRLLRTKGAKSTSCKAKTRRLA
jgi:hypothetical protein